MKKKRLLSAFLTGAMALSLVACGGESASTDTGSGSAGSASSAVASSSAGSGKATSTSSASESKPVDGGQVIIGDTTQSNGDIYPFWTNNASDFKVYSLTFGAGTISVDRNGKFVTNPQVVADKKETKNEDGTLTIDYTLQKDLKWSNGEPITAKDYVFTAVYFSSPVLIDLKASDNTYGSYFDGFEAFNSGKSKVFKGVRLLGDYEFSVTIAKEYLPNYYQEGLASVAPSYRKDWLPDGVDVADDGKGAYLKGDISAKNLKKKAENRMNLTAYSGPYMKEKYDETSNTYTLKKNPEYKGNFEGVKPHIDTIVYKFVQSETQMDELSTGGVDILVNLGDSKEINTGLDLVDKGGFNYVSYPRNGYGKLVFICDRGPTQFAEVRHAVAYLLDRNDFAKTITGGHGIVVNGAYGAAQWMAEEREEEIGSLNQYSLSIENAIAELEKAGFTLDYKGNPYKSGLRYKKMKDGSLMPLILNWCSSENNPVSELLATKLANSDNVKKVGMEIKQSTVTFNELIENYEQHKENDYNIYNMGVGFNVIYSQEFTYKIGNPQNYNRIADKELEKLGKNMNLVDPENEKEYLDRFVAFQRRWNELLPDLPLYSNEYHDFFSAKLKGYEGIKDSIWDVTSQIVYCWVDEK